MPKRAIGGQNARRGRWRCSTGSQPVPWTQLAAIVGSGVGSGVGGSGVGPGVGSSVAAGVGIGVGRAVGRAVAAGGRVAAGGGADARGGTGPTTIAGVATGSDANGEAELSPGGLGLVENPGTVMLEGIGKSAALPEGGGTGSDSAPPGMRGWRRLPVMASTPRTTSAPAAVARPITAASAPRPRPHPATRCGIRGIGVAANRARARRSPASNRVRASGLGAGRRPRPAAESTGLTLPTLTISGSADSILRTSSFVQAQSDRSPGRNRPSRRAEMFRLGSSCRGSPADG
jgi:hypothetical protein